MTNKDSHQPKLILGIETSCDETAAAVMQKDKDRVHILSNIVASSAQLQAKYGGVIPEQAAREQLKSIIPVIKEALSQAFPLNPKPSTLINAIAVTQGPGLIGSLLVGVETAKTLALLWNKPLVPINHLIGHFYANWITDMGNVVSSTYYGNKTKEPKPLIHNTYPIPHFPCIGLLVSGGHTDLILMEDHGKYKYLGGTRDDAAGEAFDKTARLLGLPYPGGPAIAQLAQQGNPKVYKLPRPMIDSDDLDFSFSGLKTAVANLVHSSEFVVQSKDTDSKNQEVTAQRTMNLAASVEEAIVDVLVKKTVKAAQLHNIEHIIIAGGVASNQVLRERLLKEAERVARVVFIPPPKLCTDNAAYIATAAFYNFHPVDPLTLQANPNLSLR